MYVCMYTYVYRPAFRKQAHRESTAHTPSPPTKSLDFRGFDSSRLLRGEALQLREAEAPALSLEAPWRAPPVWAPRATWRFVLPYLLGGRSGGLRLGEHKPGRIKPGRIKRAALSLQNQNYYFSCFLIRPRLYAPPVWAPKGAAGARWGAIYIYIYIYIYTHIIYIYIYINK